jgi:hypothetical protein
MRAHKRRSGRCSCARRPRNRSWATCRNRESHHYMHPSRSGTSCTTTKHSRTHNARHMPRTTSKGRGQFRSRSMRLRRSHPHPRRIRTRNVPWHRSLAHPSAMHRRCCTCHSAQGHSARCDIRCHSGSGLGHSVLRTFLQRRSHLPSMRCRRCHSSPCRVAGRHRHRHTPPAPTGSSPHTHPHGRSAPRRTHCHRHRSVPYHVARRDTRPRRAPDLPHR